MTLVDAHPASVVDRRTLTYVINTCRHCFSQRGWSTVLVQHSSSLDVLSGANIERLICCRLSAACGLRVNCGVYLIAAYTAAVATERLCSLLWYRPGRVHVGLQCANCTRLLISTTYRPTSTINAIIFVRVMTVASVSFKPSLYWPVWWRNDNVCSYTADVTRPVDNALIVPQYMLEFGAGELMCRDQC